MTLLLQIHPTGVKLLAGTEEIQDLPIEDILPSIEWRPGVVIAAACIVDPYALLHFSDGSAILLSGDPEEGQSLAHLAHCAHGCLIACLSLQLCTRMPHCAPSSMMHH